MEQLYHCPTCGNKLTGRIPVKVPNPVEPMTCKEHEKILRDCKKELGDEIWFKVSEIIASASLRMCQVNNEFRSNAYDALCQIGEKNKKAT